ncbi:MAG: hemolysin family protein [Chloroflexi bacterium]|nr:hemolysin family protein [Chloroflexota bacterium]
MYSFITGIILLLILSGISAIWVATEYSVVASRRSRLSEMAEQKYVGAQTVINMLPDIDKFLAGLQIGVTIITIAVGVLVEPPISESILLGFNTINLNLPTAVVNTIGTLTSLVLATYINIVLGELVPRSLALRSAERLACVLVPIMMIINRLIYPFIWLLNASTRLVLRMLGIKTDKIDNKFYSIEELKMLLAESEKGGIIESEQGVMLNNIFSFGETTVREVMVPRTEMLSIDVKTSLDQVIHLLAANPLDRIPVYEESLDHIIGMLHVKDLVRAIYPKPHTLSVRQLMREPFFVPDTQRADELLQQMRTKREAMAIVLDEYGGTAGLVTLNGLLAEIVGAVGVDASSPPDIQAHSDGSALLNGLTTIGEVNNAFGIEITDPNYDTIGGYVMGFLGRIPKSGDEFEVKEHAIRLRVEEMDRLRVSKVRLFKM